MSLASEAQLKTLVTHMNEIAISMAKISSELEMIRKVLKEQQDKK